MKAKDAHSLEVCAQDLYICAEPADHKAKVPEYPFLLP